ncbi:unnamed protein product [Phytophthora fragariaefolia]|uniref:Unnamed protein product n=1 Tax=Phytophthora fragariaefolia TaxID=1490495 RepID=A0A9W6XUH3_9STRA|nr:unnamed protein product [Phytophthora fragariaefolia]
MFSSWDLVRPRFWYPMSSLEQSMMELEHMSDLMTRSRFPFDLGSEMLATPSSLDDDDFFRDLPVLAREQRPATQHRAVAAQAPAQTSKTQASIPRDHDPNKGGANTANQEQPKQQLRQDDRANGERGKHEHVVDVGAGSTTASANNDSNNSNNNNQYRRAFSSYSFSDSSIVDDKGRRVTSTRRRYEDSTGRLKAVHERQIEGKKLRTTWNHIGPHDEGQTEAMCSSGTPEEFEALWQQTPFGEAQKKTIKEQQEQQQPQLEHAQP